MARTLTGKQRAFITFYIDNGMENATEAYRQAYPAIRTKPPSVAGLEAGRLLAHPLIIPMIAEAQQLAIARIQAVVARYALSAEAVAEEMGRLAFTQMRQVVDLSTVTDPETGTKRQVLRVKDFADIDDDAHRAIVEVSQKADGTVTIKLGDKRQALTDLARLRGWIQDKPEAPVQAVQLIIQR